MTLSLVTAAISAVTRMSWQSLCTSRQLSLTVLNRDATKLLCGASLVGPVTGQHAIFMQRAVIYQQLSLDVC